ncbi:hypothetical protein CRUP_008864 [Coryphaenoides rupestris]|nr:hypothetical protein CRUP_008864 [Coryphaenoides rupestris]
MLPIRYTREAGVRSLERKIGALCRAVAVKVAEGQKVTEPEHGGPEDSAPVERGYTQEEKVEIAQRTRGRRACAPWNGRLAPCAVAVAVKGGRRSKDMATPPEMPIVIDRVALKDILGAPPFEMEVSERLTLPGVALGLAWSPLGGEIIWSGHQRWALCRRYHSNLPGLAVQRAPGAVGGIKDKVLAAHRAGVKRVILPKRNEKDLEDVPANVRAQLDFVAAVDLEDVLNAAFDGGFASVAQATRGGPQMTSKL